MSDANAGVGADVESKVAPEVTLQPTPTEPESVVASTDTPEKSVVSETQEGSTQKDNAYYEKQIKQLKAEAARKSDKVNAEREKRRKAEARLEELERSKPTLDMYGGDYDRLQKAESEYALRKVMAEERLLEVEHEAHDAPSLEAVHKANESYVARVSGYLSGEGAVSPQAYQAKEAKFNDALMQRPPDEQAFIIRELASMANTAEVVMNVADDVQKLYELATETSMFKIGGILSGARQPRKVSDPPPPIPDINGKVSGASGYDSKNLDSIKAHFKDMGIRI